MSEWQVVSLGQITSKIGSGATPRGGGESYKESGIALIRSQNVLDFKFSTNGLAFIDDAQAYELRSVSVERDDVLLNITGDSVARCCVVPDYILPARVNQHVAIVRANKDIAESHFIYYMLQSIKEELLIQSEIGATRNALTKGMIEGLKLSLPSLPEQKAIASLLSSLDDKIDLLHRQNTTLERMAETLFRQWFVEEAQEDWEEYKVSDFAEHLKQGVNPAQNPFVEYHHYSLPAFDESQRPVFELGSEILSNKYRVLENTILVSKLNPRFPRIWAIQNLPSINSVCSTEFQIFKPKQDNLYAYLYFLFGSSQARDALEMAASGTSGSHQRVRPEDMLNITTQLPSISKAIDFSETTQPYIHKITANRKQIQTLEKLRDNLLPKLMSGEVRVR